ncbi:diguanylate cyclase [Oscillospiraceae bacterium LTW-04]|nr:diguanylate cyclase [Oscillospiraceae bacterium MB24-C1]
MEEDVKYRILVVEDSLLNQHVIHNILQHKYTLAMALTAKEALEIVPRFHPHLILLDLILPDANGFQVLETLKNMEQSRNIPVIIITGMDDEASEERGLMLGAVDYIKKPFKHGIVGARVNTQIHIIKQMQMIERLGMLDGLTEISNRRAFDIQLQHVWNRALKETTDLSMLMLDIDNFKLYNDTYGHPQGDLILQSIAKVLKTETKNSSAMVFRYGGEEFSVILPTDGLAGAVHVAERIRHSVEETKVRSLFSDVVTSVTVSIGVASKKPSNANLIYDLIERADQKLYQAKHDGRNRVRY